MLRTKTYLGKDGSKYFAAVAKSTGKSFMWEVRNGNDEIVADGSVTGSLRRGLDSARKALKRRTTLVS